MEGETLVRADEIGLEELDIHVDKQQLAKSLERKKKQKLEQGDEWDIDLDKLQIGREVARGTFGTVYRSTYNGEEVAVKLLHWGEDSSQSQIAALRASLRQEAAVWQKLSHPNVAKFVGASMSSTDIQVPAGSSESNAQAYLPQTACCVVVEYVDGGTLKKFLIKNMRRKLAYKTVVHIALGMARGLAYLHSKKIVHRNVKTENMLLTIEQNIKIADFGVARIEAHNQEEMTNLTGTLGYMAPEVLQGKPYNRKCDVYSFGISLWEIYCCDMPFPNGSFADVSSAVVHQNERPEIPPCCPKAMANIMTRCWDANPEMRPEMDEVVRLLESLDMSKGGGMIPEDELCPYLCFFGRHRGR